MSFSKIEQAVLNSKGATTLPNQPTISAYELKKTFDAPAKEVCAPAFNNLVENELPATTAAADIGAIAPAGRTGATIQAVINSVSGDLATLEASAGQAIADAHTHTNKGVLDNFADDGTGLTYDGNPVGAVTSVNNKTGAVNLDASDVGALPNTTPIPANTSDLNNDSNFVSDASYVHTDNNYDATAKGIVDGATAAIAAKSTVSWNQIDTTGTKIAEITINGVTTDVKATGGGSADAYKTIKVGTTTLTASGADTIEFVADDNIILTPDSTTTPKQIKIKSTGGGTGSASWGGISGTLSNQTDLQTALDAKANTSALATVATSGSYDDLSDKPTIPAAQVNSDWSAASGVAQILNKPSLATVATSGSYNDLSNKPTIPAAQIQSDWNQTNTSSLDYIKNKPSVLGHNMLDNSTIIAGINSSIGEGTSNDDVVSAYGVGIWSNVDGIKILSPQLSTGTDTIGTWEDDATWETGSRVGWIWHSALYNILGDNDYDIEPIFVLVSGKQTAISCLSYRIDDNVSNDGVKGGAFAMKLSAPIPAEQNNVKVGLLIKHNRTNTFNGTAISS